MSTAIEPMICAYETGEQQGAAAMLERITRLASKLHAEFPADYPQGARASFADYLRINSAALLGNDWERVGT